MDRIWHWTGLGIALVCAGCSSTPPPSDPAAAAHAPAAGSVANPGLAGTRWRLVAFQSMDDTQGTTRPLPERVHTIAFEADGRLSAQLDCNRGSATWQEGIANATGGTVTIGPVAATRALCPPPSMGERMATLLPHVASYRLMNGHLFLALKIDGGIFEFRPE